MPDGSSSAGPRDQPESKQPQDNVRTFIGRFVELGLGEIHGAQLK